MIRLMCGLEDNKSVNHEKLANTMPMQNTSSHVPITNERWKACVYIINRAAKTRGHYYHETNLEPEPAGEARRGAYCTRR